MDDEANDPRPLLRDREEIQRAHDILASALFDPRIRAAVARLAIEDEVLVRTALDALCWVLNHEHNQSFAQNLAELEEELRAAGFAFARLKEPIKLGEALFPGKTPS